MSSPLRGEDIYFLPHGESVRFHLAGPRWVIEQGLQRLKEAVAEA